MNFFPLTLGVPKPRALGNLEEGQNRAAREWEELAWRESLSAPPEAVDEMPASAVLERLMGTNADQRPWLILGEPGAGKSSLLAHWNEVWLRSASSLRLGMKLPAFVRLAELSLMTLRGSDPSLLADHLWKVAENSRIYATEGRWNLVLGGLAGRLFAPVWLLDGLDEIGADLEEPSLWDAIGALPGHVVLSCRTSVFQAARRETAGRLGAEYRVLGLKADNEQPDFLAAALQAVGFDPSPAKDIVTN